MSCWVEQGRYILRFRLKSKIQRRKIISGNICILETVEQQHWDRTYTCDDWYKASDAVIFWKITLSDNSLIHLCKQTLWCLADSFSTGEIKTEKSLKENFQVIDSDFNAWFPELHQSLRLKKWHYILTPRNTIPASTTTWYLPQKIGAKAQSTG